MRYKEYTAMQNDLVEVFKTNATGLGFTFSYGNKANQNLLQSDMIVDQVYLLLDPVTRSAPSSEFGGLGVTTFSGSFLLAVKSTIDQVYEDKYKENIKPLINNQLEDLKSLFNCDAYQITGWSYIDGINLLDINLDGLVVTYTISIL